MSNDDASRAATPRDARSLRDHGPFSAYCKVCWYQVYRAWIDDEPHNGVCIHGRARAEECPEAMNRAADAASLLKAMTP